MADPVRTSGDAGPGAVEGDVDLGMIVTKVLNSATGEWVHLSHPVMLPKRDALAFAAGYQQRLTDEWHEKHPAANLTFTAPAPGTYHVSGLARPHPTADCTPECGNISGALASTAGTTMVVEFATRPGAAT